MKQIAKWAAAAAIAATPALGQEENRDIQDGMDLLEEGTKLFLRGLLQELEPALEGWQSLADMLSDLSLYHPPEVLPNGDIIIRRKHPLEPGSGEDGETDI